MFARSVLITGCNRGIGLELVKELVGKSQRIFATCRTPEKAVELQEIAQAHRNVMVLKLDVTQEEDIAAIVAKVTEVVGEDGLNCLINNAGSIIRDDFDTITAENLLYLYKINTIGPAMLSKECLPLIRKASSLHCDDMMSVKRASILNISSVLGSFGENTSGKNYSYRMSKTALNMLTKNLSIELKEDKILAVNIHPGWVQTDMGGPNASIDKKTSVEGIMKMAPEFTEKDSGMFFRWNGEKIPW